MTDEIRKHNAADLRRKWNKFLKEQKAKHGHKTIVGDAEKRPEALDEHATAYSV